MATLNPDLRMLKLVDEEISRNGQALLAVVQAQFGHGAIEAWTRLSDDRLVQRGGARHLVALTAKGRRAAGLQATD